MVTKGYKIQDENTPVTFSDNELSIELIKDKDQVTLKWKGKSKSKDPCEKLLPYFNTILDLLKGNAVTVDFRLLEYINSSTIPPIITLAKNLNDNDIKTEFCYDKDSSWQGLSFSAFGVITHKMKNIDVQSR